MANSSKFCNTISAISGDNGELMGIPKNLFIKFVVKAKKK